MAKQDDWVRLTVRLPPEVYARLTDTVATGPNSMNAEIVARLEASFEAPPPAPNLDHISDETEKAIRRAVSSSLYHVTKTMAAIAEAGKAAEAAGDAVNYTGMIREMADEFRDVYLKEVDDPEETEARLHEFVRQERERRK